MTSKELAKITVNRTPNIECPACQSMKVHSPAEWYKYHSNAGKGIDNRNKSIKK